MPLIMWLLLTDSFLEAAIIIIVVGLTDFLDGFIARKYNSETVFGFYLDAVAELPKGQTRSTGYLHRLNKHNKFFNVKPSKPASVQYTPDEILMPKKYKKYKK